MPRIEGLDQPKEKLAILVEEILRSDASNTANIASLTATARDIVDRFLRVEDMEINVPSSHLGGPTGPIALVTIDSLDDMKTR